MLDINEAWDNYCEGITIEPTVVDNHEDDKETPKCTDIYISTKTKISYLNSPIKLADVFWKIPILPYHTQKEGVVKKQMKFNSMSQEELDIISDKVTDYDIVDEFVITQIINPDGRIKFKDVRKVSIGISKKDITSYRCKKKSAFYNCFVMILRLFNEGKFKEIHVKVFNTGKLEIPGIQTDEILLQALELLTKILRPFVDSDTALSYSRESETVLINSNFNCGYFINREKLYDILKYKYNINSAYDPCSYPGIQCEFYHDIAITEQTGKQPSSEHNRIGITRVSFMVFRTGSILIVGKCTEHVLYEIYDFIKAMLVTEYKNIGGQLVNHDDNKKKKRKVRKKTIIFN